MDCSIWLNYRLMDYLSLFVFFYLTQILFYVQCALMQYVIEFNKRRYYQAYTLKAESVHQLIPSTCSWVSARDEEIMQSLPCDIKFTFVPDRWTIQINDLCCITADQLRSQSAKGDDVKTRHNANN